MKIISREKDYYDFLLGKYGSDPKIILDRKKILENIVNYQSEFDWRYLKENFSYRILVVCGKYYPLIAKRTATRTSEFRLISVKDLKNKTIRWDLQQLLPVKTGWFAKKEFVIKTLESLLDGIYQEKLVVLSKIIKSPIFVILNQQVNNTIIDIHVPNLSKIGSFSSIYPAETLFTDLAFFIGNVLNNSVDNVHLIISDKDKILKGGFDLKTSFRGRV